LELNLGQLGRLIEIASKSGVRSIKIGADVEVIFDAGTMNAEAALVGTEPLVSSGNDTQEVTPLDEAEANAIRLQELIITDPVEYERLQAEVE
jgi:hypothetical protein